MSSDSPRVRFGVVGIVTVSLFAALFARLWFLQVMQAPDFAQLAEANRVRTVQEEAPRGRILDRKGKVLVDNRRSIVVTVDWQRFDKLDLADENRLLAKLARVLTVDAQRRASGELTAGDPGALGPTEGADGADGADGETSDGTSTSSTTTSTTTTTTTTPPEGTVTATPAKAEAVTVASLRRRLNDQKFSHFKPVPVATDVSEQLEVQLTESAAQYPTVSAERITVRSYRYGQLLAHVLGYVGAVNEDDLEEFQNREKPYENDDEVGKTGIERTMESYLRGVPGEVRYEVDARNRPVRRLTSRPSVPGDDVYLSIDIDLQFLTEKSLAAQLGLNRQSCDKRGCYSGGRSGSAVVTDPRNGQVLSMASYPTYNPAEFVGGISTEAYKALTAEGSQNPLQNKAVAGAYAPGSTWKLFTAYSGLANRQVTPADVVNDPGFYKIPGCEVGKCEKQNANRQPHGAVNLSQALTVSSDVYFYKLGDEMWRRRDLLGNDALAKTYRSWGFGEPTGASILGESSGRVPTPEWKKKFAAQLYEGDQKKIDEYGGWYSGDNMNTAIGQGDVLVTPMQLANGYATFANGGTLYAPQFVLQVTKAYSATMVDAFEPDPVRRLEMPPEWRGPMLEGFKGVTVSGTAASTFQGFDQSSFAVAGKTGTAQVNGKADTSLFAAFAPADAPRFAAAAILPESGDGGKAAAPLIRRILEPVQKAGGNLALLPAAPEGGSFDAAAAAAEVVAPPSESGD